MIENTPVCVTCKNVICFSKDYGNIVDGKSEKAWRCKHGAKERFNFITGERFFERATLPFCVNLNSRGECKNFIYA